MKKIILTMMLMASISQAQGFFGIEVGTQTLNSNFNTEDTGTVYGFKFGSQQTNWRTSFGYNYFDSGDSKLTQNLLYVSADYIFTNEVEVIRPYIGGNVGYTFFDYDGNEVDNSFSYGLQAGVILNLDYNFNIDVGAKYTLYSNSVTYPYYYEDYYIEAFDDSLSFTIGLNYKF